MRNDFDTDTDPDPELNPLNLGNLLNRPLLDCRICG
jgi:hypothetical protein